MNEKHFFADVDLPFHVWVREGTGRGFRWVLKHAAEVRRMAPASTRGAPEAAPGGCAGGQG